MDPQLRDDEPERTLGFYAYACSSTDPVTFDMWLRLDNQLAIVEDEVYMDDDVRARVQAARTYCLQRLHAGTAAMLADYVGRSLIDEMSVQVGGETLQRRKACPDCGRWVVWPDVAPILNNCAACVQLYETLSRKQ